MTVESQKEDKNDVPKVLLQANERAKQQAENFTNNVSSYVKGPWDEGHWANRK